MRMDFGYGNSASFDRLALWLGTLVALTGANFAPLPGCDHRSSEPPAEDPPRQSSVQRSMWSWKR